jgi:hypothetical protein
MEDCADLLGICLNSSLRNHKPQELPVGDTESALYRIELHLVTPQRLEGLPQICYMAGGSDALDKHIVDINFYVLPDLISEHLVHQPLVRGPNIF